jgi:hypothetical protein
MNISHGIQKLLMGEALNSPAPTDGLRRLLLAGKIDIILLLEKIAKHF